jgi:hypothetical protein
LLGCTDVDGSIILRWMLRKDVDFIRMAQDRGLFSSTNCVFFVSLTTLSVANILPCPVIELRQLSSWFLILETRVQSRVTSSEINCAGSGTAGSSSVSRY